jgi:membrane protein
MRGGGPEPVTWRAMWKLAVGTASRWNDIDAPRLGAAIAFYAMLSTAPLLVISIGIAALIFGHQAAQGRIVAALGNQIGAPGAAAIQELLRHANHLGSGIAALTIGVLLLFFGASSLFGELRDSLNVVWGIKTNTGPGWMALVRYRLTAFLTVLGVGFLLLILLLLTMTIAATGRLVRNAVPLPEWLLQTINVFISFAIATVFFALLYKVIPDVRIEWRDVWIGAALTSFLFSIGKLGIGLYIAKAGIASAYGAAGTLVVFLLWVYYSAQIFFLGAEFTHAFSERHGSRARAQWSLGGQLPGAPQDRVIA